MIAALLSSLIVATAAGPRQVPDSQAVVFVCEHGTVKSVVALAFFRRFAQERGLPFRVISRGTDPDPMVPEVIRNGLREDGILLGPFRPTRFSSADLTGAAVVISFDRPTIAGVVAGRVPTVAWNGLPAFSDGYAVARDSIRIRVRQLVDSLAESKVGQRPRGPR